MLTVDEHLKIFEAAGFSLSWLGRQLGLPLSELLDARRTDRKLVRWALEGLWEFTQREGIKR